MEKLDPLPPPKIKDGNEERFCASHGFIFDIGGMGVSCSISVFALREALSLIGVGGGGGGWVFVVPFYSVRDFSPSYMSTGLSQAVRW